MSGQRALEQCVIVGRVSLAGTLYMMALHVVALIIGSYLIA